MVIISSDEELNLALDSLKVEPNCSQRPLLRLYISLAGGARPEQQSPQPESPSQHQPDGNNKGELHVGVTCDSCNGPVRGLRYKCLTCPDFDLCGKCDSAGVHLGHDMLRVSGGLVRQLIHKFTSLT